jgi:branched-chain amino acid transport system permease protein
VEDFLFELYDVIQAAADGVLFGSTYALIGIGFTLIFGAMEKLNMSYAASSFAGAYTGLAVLSYVDAPFLVVLLSAVLSSGLVSYVVYLTCFRFIPVHNHLASLMASVGMLFFIDEVIIHATNASPLAFPALFDDVMIEIGPFGLRGDLIFIFAISGVSTVALLLLLFRTRLGFAIRAVSQQGVAAQLCGIDIHRTNGITFIIAGMLGGVGGAMIGASVGMLSPLLTIPVTVKGLIVTVIGGLGNIPGAIVAGFLVGASENLFLFFRGVNERDMYVMLLLFAFLVFRPHGIFSRRAERD